MLLYEDHRDEAAAVAHKAVVYALAFAPDGSTVASGARDGSVFVRGVGGPVVSLVERAPKAFPVHALGYLPNSQGLIAGGAFGWRGYRTDGDRWTEFGPKAGPPVTSLAVLSDRVVAIGTGDRFKASGGTLELWDVTADRKLLPYFHEPNGVRAITAAPAKKIVAWATGHRKVRVWDITTPKPIEFPQDRDCPSLAISPDGTTLAVAEDWNTKLYDLKTKRERAVLKGHKGQVLSVALSPDGSTVATGGFDFTVRLWDAASGRERACFTWDIGRVYCVTYAPDGLRLAAGGDLGRVIVWDAE